MSNKLPRILSALVAAGGLAIAAHSLAQSSPQQEFELVPKGPVSIDEETGEVVATGGAQIIYQNWLLTADTIRYNQQTGQAEAIGNVVFSREELRMVAESLLYLPQEQFARVRNFRAGNGLVYVDGALLEGNPENFRFEDVNFYPGEPGTFLFEASAGELALVDKNVVRGRRLFFKVGPVPFLLIPNITQPLDAETNLFKPNLDYSGHIGASIGAEALAPISRHLRLGGNFALTSDRGILFGPAARYTIDKGNSVGTGSFISGYIDDNGEPGVDILGRPIEDDRYFAEWRHQQVWDGNRASVSAYARYWSDSEVTRDFYEESFDRMQDPDSYLQAYYNGENWQLGFLARAAINDFQFNTERLPELRFSYFPTKLFDRVTHSGFISAARLDKDHGLVDWEGEPTRVDGFYGWEYNRSLRDGITLGLKAGARGYRYDDAQGVISYGHNAPPSAPPVSDPIGPTEVNLDGERAFGEIGLDLAAKAYSEFEFKSDSWNIDGLRHILEPRISYRYTPDLQVDDNVATHLDFDRGTFNNYLQPIDLEERRDVDSLVEDHKIRFELRNRIQTRGEGGGSRNLARLDLATDYYLKGSYFGDDHFSLLHIDFDLTPAPWLAFVASTRLDPDDSFNEKDSSVAITVQDPGYWRISFGSHFLSGRSTGAFAAFPLGYPYAFLDSPYALTAVPGFPGYRSFSDLLYRPDPLIDRSNNLRLEQYFAHLEYYLNENLKLYATVRYDDESGAFYEQRIGLMQRALERYGLKYEIRIYDGDRREQDFGISLGIDLFDE